MKTFQSIIFGIFLALLPLHAFLATVTGEFIARPLGLQVEFFAAWKEILFLLFVFGTLLLLVFKKIPCPRFDELDVVILLYMVWALGTGFWRWGMDIERIIWGAKYSLLFLGIFLFARHFPFSEKVRERFWQIILASGAVVILFGLFQKILPPDFLVSFGYSPEFSTFDPSGAPAFCQKISFTDTCRLQSFLSGPNQFAAYLLFLLPLFFTIAFSDHFQKKAKKVPLRAFAATMFFVGLGTLLFTYSRSAWGGALVSFSALFFVLFAAKKWFQRLFWIGLASAGGILLILLLMIPRPYARTCDPYDDFPPAATVQEDGFLTSSFCRVVYRPSSSQGHFERSRDGIQHILLHPFGTGLGDSGPASARFYDNKIGFIPESWYLQVGIDTGFPGLILFLAILFLLGKKLLASASWQGLGLFAGLIGISVMALKLHAWESADVAYTFWALSGLLLGVSEKQSWWQLWRKRWSDFVKKLKKN